VAESSNGYVAECFWVGVNEQDLRSLDLRAESTAADLTAKGEKVRYLGSILMRPDEVVLCFFEGSAASVRRAAVEAKVPFERILESTGAAWLAAGSTGREQS
jgi:hypothetical protein